MSILSFIYFSCDDFNLWTGAMGEPPTPSEIQKIIASDAEDNDIFGTSVSISEDYAIVGAMREDGTGTDRGAAYIFKVK